MCQSIDVSNMVCLHLYTFCTSLTCHRLPWGCCNDCLSLTASTNWLPLPTIHRNFLLAWSCITCTRWLHDCCFSFPCSPTILVTVGSWFYVLSVYMSVLSQTQVLCRRQVTLRSLHCKKYPHSNTKCVIQNFKYLEPKSDQFGRYQWRIQDFP